jgi:hypothetical protein
MLFNGNDDVERSFLPLLLRCMKTVNEGRRLLSLSGEREREREREQLSSSFL